MLGNKPHLLKELNRKLVMRIVWNESPISRAELARKTGLSGPAILKIVKGLLKDGYLKEIGEGESRGGRRPVLLTINKNGAYAIGVQLTPKKIRVALVGLNFEIITELKQPIDPESGYEPILNQIATLVKQVIYTNNISRSKILGIGLTHPGVMGEESGKILIAVNLKSWSDVPLGIDLEKRLGLPVILEVDARALAIAESWLGHATRAKNFLTVDIDIGVGAAIALDGKIYRGAHGLAGELGHMVIEENGFPCSCGKNGCLETLVSFRAIIREIKSRLEEAKLYGLDVDKENELDMDMVLNAAQKKNPVVCQVIEKAARILGKTIGNLLTFINVEMVFINSDLTVLGEGFLKPLHEEIAKYYLFAKSNPIEVVASALGQDADLIGAAILILRDIFHVDEKMISPKPLKHA